MKNLSLLVFALAVASVVAAAQKSATTTSSVSLSHALTSTVRTDEVDGAMWARGKNWKASFAPDGTSFIPFLGADLPRNYPVTFGFLGATIGGKAISAKRGIPATRSDAAMNFDRGPLHEIYRLEVGAIEQTFVIAAPLDGTGDLAIHLSVETEMSSRSTDRGIEFRMGESGGVNYGKAIVIDADGRRGAVSQILENGRLTLVCPAEFLATAKYPVVVDPVISTFTLVDIVEPLSAPDSAHLVEVTTGADTFATTYESTFSASDHDVFVVLTDYLGNIGVTFMIDFSSSDWRGPRVASNGNATTAGYPSGDFMVAARRAVPGGSQAMCRGIGLAGTITGQIIISPPGHFVRSIDIGGDPDYFPFAGTENRYAIVYEHEVNGFNRDVYGLIVTASGATAVPVFPVDNSAWDDTAPRISDNCGRDDGSLTGSGKLWTVVWQRQSTFVNRDIITCSISLQGVPSPIFAVTSSNFDDANPTVSAFTDGTNGPRTAMVAWQRNYFNSTFDIDIYGMILSPAGLASAETNLSALDTPALLGIPQTFPCVATNGCRFAVAYVEPWVVNQSDLDIYASTFSFDGTQILCDEAHTTLTFDPSVDSQPSIAAYMPFQIPSYYSHEFFGSWVESTNNSIRSAIYYGHAPMPPVILRPAQVGIATIGAFGAPSLGNYFNFGMTGPAPTDVQLLWIGAPLPALVPVLPPIQLGVADPPLVVIDNVLAQTPYTPDQVGFIVPCNHVLVGITLAVQGFAIGPAGTLGGVLIPGAGGLEASCTDVLEFTFQ